MGIEGLWKSLEPLREEVHLAARFRGRIIGVDGDHLLHSLAGGHVLQLVHGDYQPLVDRFVKQLTSISRRCNVDFVIAFDGGDPPMKEEEQERRKDKKELARSVGLELLLLGFQREGEAMLKKAPPVGACLATLASALRRNGYEVIQAPMEAEAQLAFMNRRGLIEAVWTGDSDAVMYFARRVIRSIDIKNCTAVVYECSDPAAWSRVGSIAVHDPSLFILMCVMGGSDYSCHRSSSLRAIGQLLSQKNVTSFSQAVKLIASEYRMSAGEQDRIVSAVGAFLYHWVFDPETGKIIHNFAPPRSADEAQVPGRDVLGEPPRNPIAHCRDGVGFDQSDIPLVRRAFDKFQFLPDSDRSFVGRFDCRTCQVSVNSADAFLTHCEGALHKGLELIRKHRPFNATTAEQQPQRQHLRGEGREQGGAKQAAPPSEKHQLNAARVLRPNGEIDLGETITRRIKTSPMPQGIEEPPADPVALARALSSLRLGGSTTFDEGAPPTPLSAQVSPPRDTKAEEYVKDVLFGRGVQGRAGGKESAQPPKGVVAPPPDVGAGLVRIVGDGAEGAKLGPLATLLASGDVRPSTNKPNGKANGQKSSNASKNASRPPKASPPAHVKPPKTKPTATSIAPHASSSSPTSANPPQRVDGAGARDQQKVLAAANVENPFPRNTAEVAPNTANGAVGSSLIGRDTATVHRDPVTHSAPQVAHVSGFLREVFVEDE